VTGEKATIGTPRADNNMYTSSFTIALIKQNEKETNNDGYKIV
jgi:hypothetical protein